MKLLLLLTCSVLFSATSNFNVEGMMCGVGCANKIKTQVNSLDGIKSCDVNFDKGIMTVKYDETKLDDKLIIKTLTDKTTYTCTIKKDDEPKKGFFKRIFGWF